MRTIAQSARVLRARVAWPTPAADGWCDSSTIVDGFDAFNEGEARKAPKMAGEGTVRSRSSCSRLLVIMACSQVGRDDEGVPPADGCHDCKERAVSTDAGRGGGWKVRM